MENQKNIRIIHASENNLKSLSLEIPCNKLVVVTGVSGSGKSSLVFDLLYRLAENRLLGSISTSAKAALGKMSQPEVEKVEFLPPAVAIDQKSVVRNQRSTVGTISGLYDFLRLIFARLGDTDQPGLHLHRSLFSFNTQEGACPVCQGLGVEDRLDPDLLVADPTKSIRDRALVITAPNGYIIYSQVTMDVMAQVCEAEGFSIDIPWNELTEDQKQIILYGSDKIEIPYGKHTLESRMTWTGITAKPREMGYYKGIIPVMEVILKRDRNKNILRFVRTVPCSCCGGSRLNPLALSVKIGGKNIAQYASMEVKDLSKELHSIPFGKENTPIVEPILRKIDALVTMMERLGIGHLTSDRESTTLSAGEAQRLRLATQTTGTLQGLLYIFDEPSIGLHPTETLNMITVLKELRDRGNSVIVVEHDDLFLQEADWIIDMGPGGGDQGGEVIFSLSREELEQLPSEVRSCSKTATYYHQKSAVNDTHYHRKATELLSVKQASHRNLKQIDVDFHLGCFNVVTGVSGAGKTSLVFDTLGNYLLNRLTGSHLPVGPFEAIHGFESIQKIITIDQNPIGRTPRSNPATYTGLFDSIRDLFSGLPAAKEAGLEKSHFSFNTEGGRCEACEGAGYIQIGMHFMGNVEVVCEKCQGKRFKEEVLKITYQRKNIAEILDFYISEAALFFADHPVLSRYLKTLVDVGLGYVKLGQRSSTLSGGEAQRVKLATELSKPKRDHTLYLLDEPTTGLHNADVEHVLKALNSLVDEGNTLVVIEHHPMLISQADHLLELGPGSGKEGGYLLKTSPTSPEIRKNIPSAIPPPSTHIRFKHVTTHNLKNLTVQIPHGKITVITGVSGSGKSSLAFDTIVSEGMNRYLDCFSPYIRAHIGMMDQGDFTEVEGLTPTLALDQRSFGNNPRSTVGTTTGMYDLLRLLYSRVATYQGERVTDYSSLFSFNHQTGACETCKGLGTIITCDENRLITDPKKSILGGAMSGTKTGRFYGDTDGQYMATLKAVGNRHHIDYQQSYALLTDSEKEIALFGTGDETYDVTWSFKRDQRTGEHHFKGGWIGLVNLVNEEYTRKHADHRGAEMLPLMKELECHTCKGSRLNEKALSYQVAGKNIAEVASMEFAELTTYLADLPAKLSTVDQRIAEPLIIHLQKLIQGVVSLGLSYLSMHRSISTLSGGEAQRVKLSSQLINGLTGVTYVLDEPTLGLHPADVESLMQLIAKLKEAGNTIIIVEHDRNVILEADYLLELGPGAGQAGGEIVAEGSVEEVRHHPTSILGRYLRKGFTPPYRESIIPDRFINMNDVHLHNLKHVTVSIPTNGLVVVTGVSGSGKSTLMHDILYQSWVEHRAVGCSAIEGLEQFQHVIWVEQKNGFSSSSGSVVTYAGMFTRIREHFASAAKSEGLILNKNHFSFTSKEGQCPQCSGTGKRVVHLDFLPDVVVPCEACEGKRYKKEVLECHYKGVSIADLLELPFNEASALFTEDATLSRQFELFTHVGLGYLPLGQSLDTLSGGEVERLTLLTELIKPSKGRTLYLFEEPSTGLHFNDIEHLLVLFQKLIQEGNSIIVIEHDPQIIQQADWIIDMGPQGGKNGGCVVAEGRLDAILNHPDSVTGLFLRRNECS